MNEIDQGNVEFYTYQCIKKSSFTTTVSLSMLIVSFCLVSYSRQTDAQIRENFIHSVAVKAVTTIICLFLYHVLQRYIEKSKDKLKQASVFPTDIFLYGEYPFIYCNPIFFKIKHTSLRRRLVQF